MRSAPALLVFAILVIALAGCQQNAPRIDGRTQIAAWAVQDRSGEPSAFDPRQTTEPADYAFVVYWKPGDPTSIEFGEFQGYRYNGLRFAPFRLPKRTTSAIRASSGMVGGVATGGLIGSFEYDATTFYEFVPKFLRLADQQWHAFPDPIVDLNHSFRSSWTLAADFSDPANAFFLAVDLDMEVMTGHFDGTAWSRIDSGAFVEIPDCEGFSVAAPGVAWAHCTVIDTPYGQEKPRLIRFDAGAGATFFDLPSPYEWQGPAPIGFDAPDHGFIAIDASVLLEYDDGVVTVHPIPAAGAYINHMAFPNGEPPVFAGYQVAVDEKGMTGCLFRREAGQFVAQDLPVLPSPWALDRVHRIEGGPVYVSGYLALDGSRKKTGILLREETDGWHSVDLEEVSEDFRILAVDHNESGRAAAYVEDRQGDRIVLAHELPAGTPVTPLPSMRVNWSVDSIGCNPGDRCVAGGFKAGDSSLIRYEIQAGHPGPEEEVFFPLLPYNSYRYSIGTSWPSPDLGFVTDAVFHADEARWEGTLQTFDAGVWSTETIAPAVEFEALKVARSVFFPDGSAAIAGGIWVGGQNVALYRTGRLAPWQTAPYVPTAPTYSVQVRKLAAAGADRFWLMFEYLHGDDFAMLFDNGVAVETFFPKPAKAIGKLYLHDLLCAGPGREYATGKIRNDDGTWTALFYAYDQGAWSLVPNSFSFLSSLWWDRVDSKPWILAGLPPEGQSTLVRYFKNLPAPSAFVEIPGAQDLSLGIVEIIGGL